MADNVAKTIQITGPVQDLAFIYQHAQNICDNWVQHIPADPFLSPVIAELGRLVELIGGNPQPINGHGWSTIESVDFSNNSLEIECITPYGNLSELMPWFRKRFPECEFHVWKDVSTEDNPDNMEENEFD